MYKNYFSLKVAPANLERRLHFKMSLFNFFLPFWGGGCWRGLHVMWKFEKNFKNFRLGWNFIRICEKNFWNLMGNEVTASVIICEKFRVEFELSQLCKSKTYWHELWDLKKEFVKKSFLRKWLFKMLVIFFTIWEYIFQQIFVLKRYAFVQERNLLSNSSKCHKNSDLFLSVSMIIWKSDILFLSQMGPFTR